MGILVKPVVRPFKGNKREHKPGYFIVKTQLRNISRDTANLCASFAANQEQDRRCLLLKWTQVWGGYFRARMRETVGQLPR